MTKSYVAAVALVAAVLSMGVLAPSANAATTADAGLFQMTDVSSMGLLSHGDHKCGAHSCGGDHGDEHKCSGDDEHHNHDGDHDGDHKCGGDHHCGSDHHLV